MGEEWQSRRKKGTKRGEKRKLNKESSELIIKEQESAIKKGHTGGY